MRPLLGLVFDLDGTLMDSAGDLRLAVNTLLAAHGRRPVTLDEVRSMVGDGLRTMMRRAFAATGGDLTDAAEATAMQDFIRIYQSQPSSPDILYPHARETIALFRKRGVKTGLCTNKHYLSTLKLLDEVGLATAFDFVAGGDSFPVCKPHPGHVLGVIEALGLAPEACAMVGDSVNDILAAQAAQVANVAVAYGYGHGLVGLSPDATIPDLADLPEALKSIGFSF